MQRFRQHALAVHPYCQWCGIVLTAESATTDHLLPRSKGGGDDWGNLLLACAPCNHRRSNHVGDAAPSGPRWGELLTVRTPSLIMWVAWTRYPGGRWRRTLRSTDKAVLVAGVRRMLGGCIEMVLLVEPEEPALEKIQVLEAS